MAISMFTSSQKPTIFVRFKNDARTHRLSSVFLQEWPIFKVYDPLFLQTHSLPPVIQGRTSSTLYNGQAFAVQLENLVAEVKQGRAQFTDFSIIRDRTFNRKLGAGSLTLKSKNYPFVVKLFMESPYSFVSPFKKGWESFGTFVVAGVSRYLTGLTRIKNLQRIKELLAHNSQWSNIETPRKWFWTPINGNELEVTGYNFGHYHPQTILLPHVYCIISDAIEPARENSFSSWRDFMRSSAHDRAALKEQSKISIELCNHLQFCIDANVDNFIIEKGTGKFFIIDTEHFPTLAGFTSKPPPITSYTSLGFFILKNSISNVFFKADDRSGIPFDMKS